nr:eukaryotic initiation factor 4A-15-like [Tanacetum cinerariifolium]
VAVEGSQFDTHQFDSKMDKLLSADGQDFFTSYDEVTETFDALGLLENLLRGIYAYGGGGRRVKVVGWGGRAEDEAGGGADSWRPAVVGQQGGEADRLGRG